MFANTPVVQEEAPQEVPAPPTKEQLEAQLTNLVVQRAALSDQIESIEKALPVIQGQLNLINHQEAFASAEIAQAEANAKD